MTKRGFLFAALLTTAALGQVPATQPDAPVAKLFRSRIAGIELVPPAGGMLIRRLDAGEIVRFVYSDRSWDIRVKPVPLHIPMPMADLLDLTARQLAESNASAEILLTHVVNKNLGEIEARYNAGADRLFAQQALIRQDGRNYFLIQMGSPTGKTKNAPVDPPDPREADARAAFAAMLPTVKLLDRSQLFYEQQQRMQNTRALWLLLDKQKIVQTLQPLHFMRIVRDNKDIGFVQVNERQASHGSHAGVEVIVRSRVINVPDDFLDRPKTDASESPAGKPDGIVISGSVALPHAAGPAVAPSNLYTLSTFYFSFDRMSGYAASHEDWETLTQVDDKKTDQVRERGNSDLSTRRLLDRRRASQQLRLPTTRDSRDDPRQPPVIDEDVFTLSVSQDVKNRRAPSFDCQLGGTYLPQGLRQMLPRLLPVDEPRQYMFASYIGEQHQVLRRYVDVGTPVDLVLNDRPIHAIPVSDRIGIDGIPTIHYLSPTGEWFGSVSEEGRVQVLPASEKELRDIWPGFVPSPEPPLPVDDGEHGMSADDQPGPAVSGLQPNGAKGR